MKAFITGTAGILFWIKLSTWMCPAMLEAGYRKIAVKCAVPIGTNLQVLHQIWHRTWNHTCTINGLISRFRVLLGILEISRTILADKDFLTTEMCQCRLWVSLRNQARFRIIIFRRRGFTRSRWVLMERWGIIFKMDREIAQI